jgi:hypothetical protein
MSLATSSYDAPVLHVDLQLRLQAEISSPKKCKGKKSSISFDQVAALRRQ